MARGGRVKRYPEEFKQTAVELAMAGDTSESQVVRDLEINENTLHNWLRLHRENNGNTLSVADDGNVEVEFKRLRKEHAQLKKERDILKKATAFFAKEAHWSPPGSKIIVSGGALYQCVVC